MKTTVIHTLQKDEHEEIRISLLEDKNKHYVDVRLFSKIGNKYVPSKEGLTLGIEHLSELSAGVQGVRDEILRLHKKATKLYPYDGSCKNYKR
ncbi:MAG: hypothetical protein E2O29_01725 [Deltaproteobacteria bacterium]|nr:MAG: hypothetical protein E2O29_01725 [Deltaproteobacteria bacterium]